MRLIDEINIYNMGGCEKLGRNHVLPPTMFESTGYWIHEGTEISIWSKFINNLRKYLLHFKVEI